MGCLLFARLVGVIEAEQTEDGATTRNDRLLALATRAHTHADVKALTDLRPKRVDEIEQFFRSYNQTKGKVFQPVGRGGPEEALRLVRESQERFAEEGT